MILAVDCQYNDDKDVADVAAVLFAHWQADEISETFSYLHHGLAPYQPGQFYRRELPCILPLITQIMSAAVLDIIIVDGYVDLNENRPGLGRRLHNALPTDITVVGVAKNKFDNAPAKAVLRGQSHQPVWVSSTDTIDNYAEQVFAMHGNYRIPSMLKNVDRLARGLPL